MGEKGKMLKKITKVVTSSRSTTRSGPNPDVDVSNEILVKKKSSSEQSQKSIKKSVKKKRKSSPEDCNEKQNNLFVIVDPTLLQLVKDTPTNEEEDMDDNNNNNSSENSDKSEHQEIPEVLKKQGTASFCSNAENTCPCNTMEDVEQMSKQISYCNRKTWITVDRLNELRKKAQEALKSHKTFTIRGCFFSVRNALVARGWVEKLDVHRKNSAHVVFQVSYEDITQTLPKRRPGESRRQYLIKCERNIMSRFLEHMPIDFLWTARKEKCDWIDQAKNPLMIINKFHRVPFTTKEGLCGQLRDFHWFYEEGMAELRFPRCYNVWSPEELNDFTENFRLTGCISFLKWILQTFSEKGYDAVFAVNGKIPFTSIEFAMKRCIDYIDNCNHNDIDNEENVRIWEHDWDAFFTQHHSLTHDNARIAVENQKIVDPTLKSIDKMLENIKPFWPQYSLDGYLNIWIVKPANKCRGRGIHLMNNYKKIVNMVNPSIATKSRYVVQKYVERPLIIHNTKFDIRQWFLVTNVQPLVIWMYKESYLRFSSQEYNLQNYHESVHLTNHAVQKKYRNARRDKRLPSENMWDCYTFQAYLRQIGKQEMWSEQIYPEMRNAIVGAMLASQENMDRRANTFELFGADFLISENFHAWLIEINSSPDLGGTTSVTARMCPQCLEDVIKVIDRRNDPKADTGNFELIYRQIVPPTPAYMGLNLFLKGRQLITRANGLRREKTSTGFHYSKQQTNNLSHYSSTLPVPSQVSVSPFQNINFGSEKAGYTGPIIIDILDETVKDNDLVFKKNPFYQNSTSSSSYTLRTDTTPTLGNNSSRLLTPIIPSNRSDQQNSISPRISSSSRRPSKESGWKQPFEVKLKPPQLAQNPSRRHLSCGPKIRATDDAADLCQDIQDSSYLAPENKFECIGSKYSAENLTIVEDSSANKSPPRTVNLASSSKQFFELLYKTKAAKVQRTTKTVVAAKPKSSPNTLSSGVNNNIRRNCLTSVKKMTNCENSNRNKIQKSANMKKTNLEYVSSPFHTAGMSLRTWRSRNYKILKDVSGSQQMGLMVCKSAPVTSPIRSSPKRQLCKNLSKKLAGQVSRGSMGC